MIKMSENLNVRMPKKMKEELQKEADIMYRSNLSSLVLNILDIYLGGNYLVRNRSNEKI